MGHWIFNEEHEAFRRSIRRFVDAEIKPHIEEWEEAGEIPRSLYKKAGELGYLGIRYPTDYGGSGLDAITEAVLAEEMARTGAGGIGASLTATSTIAMTKILLFGSDEQKETYLPKGIKGEKVFALGITEPGAGSDVANLKTTAKRDGDHYVINGSKTFITNGVNADYVIIAAKTADGPKHQNISLFIVDTTLAGYSVGKKLRKLGWRSSDTGEIFLDNVKVSQENLIGQENHGFLYTMKDFQYERIHMALSSVALADLALEAAKQYSKERTQFGQPIAHFQVLRHKMVDMAVDIEKARNITYRALYLYNEGKDVTTEATMAKAYATEMVRRVTDKAVQIHGGNGYMMEFPVQRYWRDARIQSIGGGTTEIMNEILTKQLGIVVKNN